MDEDKNNETTRLYRNMEIIKEQLLDLTVLLKNDGLINSDDFERLNEKARKIK